MSPEELYSQVPYPKSRQPIVDYLSVARHKHVVFALIELDVTLPRQIIHRYKELTGETISFTAFIIHCLGQVVGENLYLHAYRKGRSRLVLYDEVDISTPVEQQVGGRLIGVPYIVRAANTKSVLQIHQEIRSAQGAQVREKSLMSWYGYLPNFIGRAFWRLLGSNPHWRKRLSGTVGVTAVGMFGKGAGWGIPISDYTLQLTLGGIAEKPVVVDGSIAIRELLSLTICADHDVIDGAPLARFAQRFKELVESGSGLDEIITTS